MSQDVQTILFAIAGGFLPAFIWLWFWLKEDKKHPEPKRLIALAFIGGIISVLPVLKLEGMVYNAISNETLRIIIWASIEEIGILSFAYFVILRRKEVDEPLDYAVYLITTTLGFAALENALFLTNPEASGLTTAGLMTTDLRFIGATLLHVASSGIIGITLAFSFYKNRIHKIIYFLTGVILAIALHTAFNLSIITAGGKNSLFVSALVWAIIVVLLLILEKVKRVHPTS
jgi:protease PrsW